MDGYLQNKTNSIIRLNASMFRPHYQFPKYLSLIGPVVILIFAVLININRFFEYKTEVGVVV